MTGWTFDQGAPTRQQGLSAPTYKDPFTDFLGGAYYDKNNLDPALAMTLNAGRSGSMQSGLGAFLPSANNNDFQAANSQLQGGSRYADADMQNLAKQFGIDTQGKTGTELESLLAPALKDYVAIGGMSAGWNPTGDMRGANGVLYKRENGQLVPYQQGANYSAPQTSQGFIGDNPGVLAPLALATGGLAAIYLGAAGAAGGAAAGAGGITGTGGASGLAAYGAGAAPGAFATAGTGSLGAGLASTGGYLGAGGLAGSTAYAGLGSMGGAGGAGGGGGLSDWYNSLPKYQQQALQGGVKSGITSGGDPRATLTGAVTGGIGGEASSLLGDMGAPGWLSSVGGKVAGGLAGMGIGSVLGGSGGGGGPSDGGSGDAGGLSGGVGGGSGSGGSLQPHLGAAAAQQAAFLRDSYAPVAQELQRQKLKDQLQDDF